jgi:hypothetical protein
MPQDELSRRMHRVAIDLTVVFERDQPGTLAVATEAIARSGINIDACAEIDGRLHLVTSDAESARNALAAAGFAVTGEQPALVIDAVDRPGTAAAIFRRMADAGINIYFAYVGARNRIVIGPDDVERAAAALEE